MLQGERPSQCRACYHLESIGVESWRQELNRTFRDEFEEARAAMQPDGSVVTGLLTADFRLGNICNLRCRMCSPHYSRLLAAEWAELGFGRYQAEEYMPWYEDEEYWKEFFASNPNLQHLRLAGGEPFLSERFFWLLDYLCSKGKAKNIVLSINTNLTRLTQAHLEQLLRFRRIELAMSVDALGPPLEYIRTGSHWDNVRTNLDMVNRWAKFPFTRARLQITTQAYNVWRLPELLAHSISLQNLDTPTLTILSSPEELAISALPASFRAECARQLNAFLDESKGKLPPNWRDDQRKKWNQKINNVLHALKQEGSSGLTERLIARTKAQDAFRKQSVQDYLPEFSAWFPATKS